MEGTTSEGWFMPSKAADAAMARLVLPTPP
jgi:hypothetical protein